MSKTRRCRFYRWAIGESMGSLTSKFLVPAAFFLCAATARAEDGSSANSANNPVEPKLTLEYWNYYSPSLEKLGGGAENGLGRI